VSNQNQQCASLGRWNVQSRQKESQTLIPTFKCCSSVHLWPHKWWNCFHRTNPGVCVCVCPREPGRSQIHKMGDDVKKCYYWRLSPGVARHLNVIEKESLPSHRFFLTKKKKSWCERKREKADYFSSFVAPLDKDEFGSIDWKSIDWLIDKLGDTGTKLKLNRQIELCLSRNGVQLISI